MRIRVKTEKRLAGSTLAGRGGYLAQKEQAPCVSEPKRALTLQAQNPPFFFLK